MSATIWTEIESGIDRRTAPRRQGYWSGNQGHPVRRPRPDRDPSNPFGRPVLATAR